MGSFNFASYSCSGFSTSLVVLFLAVSFGCSRPGNTRNSPSIKKGEEKEWRVYGGNPAGNRYSALSQINTKNAHKLEVAWTYHTQDNLTGKSADFQTQPIVVNGILYTITPKLKALALDAASGKLLWQFNPFENTEPGNHPSRGVTYWESGDDKRILFTAGSDLFALNALTGKLIPDFGEGGKVSLFAGVNHAGSGPRPSVIATSPGTVYQNLIILGSRVAETGGAAPGHVRAFNLKTGKLAWVFHTIPQPGEFGYNTWPPDAWKTSGGANVWSGMSLDEKRGLVFMATGSPSYDFYGGDRPGQNLFGNCIIALNAATGERVWHYQTVHHDLWDRDLPCQPNLVTVKHGGKNIDAVAQATKSGYIFLFDRETGKPLFPVEERPFPASDLPGEQAWVTQPIPLKPAPFARQVFTEADITNISPEATAYITERFKKVRSGGQFVPPSREGTVIFPGFDGGAEWGGNAFDPKTGILYINSNEMPWILTMIGTKPKENEITSPGQKIYTANCVTCHGPDRQGDQHSFPSLIGIENRLSQTAIASIIAKGRGRMPSFQHIPAKDRQALISFLLNTEEKTTAQKPKPAAKAQSDYEYPFLSTGYHRFLDKEGYPAVKPPWGTLNAINLNTGEKVWQVPLGEFSELTTRGIPQTGTENYGGPVVTAGGLIFIGATKDEKFRAFDKETGKVLFETTLPAGGYATPSTYMVNRKQYVVISAGGNKMGTKPGDAIVAFALPD